MARSSARKITQLALLTGAGLALFLFESLIPRPLPWIKPGLSQIATIVALYAYGWREAIAVVAARVCLGALLIGSFAGPGFWLALPAGAAAALVMALVHRWSGDRSEHGRSQRSRGAHPQFAPAGAGQPVPGEEQRGVLPPAPDLVARRLHRPDRRHGRPSPLQSRSACRHGLGNLNFDQRYIMGGGR